MSAVSSLPLTSALPGTHPAAAATVSSATSLYARHTEGYETRVEATIDQLRQAALDHPGSIVQATSLGAEDMVLTDLIAKLNLPIAIGTLQTGKLHAETLALIPEIESRYRLDVEIYSPREEAVVHFVRRNGDDAMYQSIELRKGCCQVRKLEPLARMLQNREAWVTGLRREQSANRGAVPLREVEANGRVKFNPLADWSWNDIWHYIESNNVPYNALHDQFMPSIGCAPCTRAIAVGEEFRAGRWWWEDEKAKECGLHAVQQPSTTDRDEAVAA